VRIKLRKRGIQTEWNRKEKHLKSLFKKSLMQGIVFCIEVLPTHTHLHFGDEQSLK